MNKKKVSYIGLDYGVRAKELLTPADYFACGARLADTLATPDRNFFLTMSKYGKDFSSMAAHRPPKEELLKAFPYLADDQADCECHNIALHQLKTLVVPEAKFKLWWGIVDFRTKKRYMGMFTHSFLTINYRGGTKIWDPMQHREDILDSGSEIYGYHGIHLPIEYLNRVGSHSASKDKNYSGYLKDCVFYSQKLTKRLWSVLEDNKAFP